MEIKLSLKGFSVKKNSFVRVQLPFMKSIKCSLTKSLFHFPLSTFTDLIYLINVIGCGNIQPLQNNHKFVT